MKNWMDEWEGRGQNQRTKERRELLERKSQHLYSVFVSLFLLTTYNNPNTVYTFHLILFSCSIFSSLIMHPIFSMLLFLYLFSLPQDYLKVKPYYVELKIKREKGVRWIESENTKYSLSSCSTTSFNFKENSQQQRRERPQVYFDLLPFISPSFTSSSSSYSALLFTKRKTTTTSLEHRTSIECGRLMNQTTFL